MRLSSFESREECSGRPLRLTVGLYCDSFTKRLRMLGALGREPAVEFAVAQRKSNQISRILVFLVRLVLRRSTRSGFGHESREMCIAVERIQIRVMFHFYSHSGK